MAGRLRKTKFIVVASGKGGAGKTTTALNLGCALSNFGQEVLLIDANLTTPHIGIALGTPRPENSINKVFSGKLDISNSAYLHPSGLKVILADMDAETQDEEYLQKIKKLLMDLKGTTDVVLIDACAGLGDNLLGTLSAADELIVVANPDLASATDALKLIRLAEERGIGVAGVVLNRFSGEKFEMTKQNIEDFLEKQVIGVIPEDSSVKKSLSIKQPVVYSHPDSAAAVGFKKLAATLLGQSYEHEVRIQAKPGFLDKIISAVNRLSTKIDKK